MTLFLTIVAFVVIFSLLILVHEIGHFWVAKMAGIKVEEFGFGFPPKIFSFKPKKSETIYTLNAIPFGGFVKLFGEDSTAKKKSLDKRSFGSQKPRVKFLVAVAGVFMNYLLSIVLLSVGFMFGIEPLYLNVGEFLNGIKTGQVEVMDGVRVKKVNSDLGIEVKSGVKVLNVNGKSVQGFDFTKVKDGEKLSVEFLTENGVLNKEIVWNSDAPSVEFQNVIYVPRVQIVENNALFHSFGFQNQDKILRVGDVEILSLEDFKNQISGKEKVQVLVLRDGSEVLIDVLFPKLPFAVITEVEVGGNAERAGVLKGDVIKSINGVEILSVSDLRKSLLGDDKKFVDYVVSRDDNELSFRIEKNERGVIGIMISNIIRDRLSGVAVVEVPTLTSVIRVKPEQYSILEAPIKAISETGRLARVSFETMLNVLGSIFTKFTVPDGISGPVGIAQMTYVFVQEGFLSLIRFAALISTSLAIVNLFPFPGLDGGRIFLILVSVVLGREINQRIESYIHITGFFILLMLIFLVTFNDIWKLVG